MMWKKWITNKYFLTIVAFLVWMVFFEENNFRQQVQLQRELKNLQAQKKYYETEIDKNNKLLKAFSSDTSLLIKYAREKYYMKKDDEDIFVIVPSASPDE